MKKDNNHKKWWQHLLVIPITLVIDAALIFAALLIDIALDESNHNNLGHGLPAVSIIVAFIAVIITIVIIVRQIGMAISSGKNKNNQIDETPVAKEIETKPVKIWKYFIPTAVIAVIGILITFLYGKNEIDSFYNDPNHIGFAVPIGTFFIAFVSIAVFVVSLIITLIVVRSKAKNK